MKRHYILPFCIITLCAILLTACKRKQQTVTALPSWLQEQVVSLDQRYSVITLYELDGESYYALFCRGPRQSFDMNRTTIYDANGNIYMTLGGLKKKTEQEAYFFTNAIDKGIIWKSETARQEDQEKSDSSL